MIGVVFLYCLSYPGTSDASIFECFYIFYHAPLRGVPCDPVAYSYKLFAALSPLSFEDRFVGLPAFIYELVNYIFLPQVYSSCELASCGPMS